MRLNNESFFLVKMICYYICKTKMQVNKLIFPEKNQEFHHMNFSLKDV